MAIIGFILAPGFSENPKTAFGQQIDADTASQKLNPEHREVTEGAQSVQRDRTTAVATSTAAIITRDRFTSYQVNVDGAGNNILADAANEPSIAVDPNNGNIMAIGWREFASNASAFRTSGYAYSTDAGVTWTFPGIVLPPPSNFASDPVLDFDAAGNFYYSSLQTQRNATCVWSVYNYKSFDGGQTWPQDVFAFGGDKQWIVVDRTFGQGHDHVYMAFTPNPSATCSPGRTFTRSTDGGLTYETPLVVPGEQFTNTITVGPDGAVYIFGSELSVSPPRFNLARSSDAQDASVTPTFDLLTFVDLDGVRTFGDIVNPGGLTGQATVATDRSNGPFHGNVYVLSTVQRTSVSDPADVMFARSEDGGFNFSAPVRVNDDTPGNGAYQWFGAMSVAPNGRIDVSWNDTRNDPTGLTSELHYSYSYDGGVTWSASEPVGPAWNSIVGQPVQAKIGDYHDMISDNGGASLASAATYNGEQDVYFVRLTPDCNGNGIADETDIATLTSNDCNGNVIPDECESQADCNTTTVQDICDIASGASDDCNRNHIPDECEAQTDCNNTAVQDICDIGAGTSEDCNRNDVPDECELTTNDCDNTGTPDDCDVAFRLSPDCNGNLRPDACDIADGTSLDDDGNGIPDECGGACCLCGGSCTETSQANCVLQGGTYNGLGTACAATVCPLALNDDCADAVTLPSDLQVTVPIDNTAACSDVDGPPQESCENGLQPVGADLWYHYTAPCCGTLTVTMCDNTAYDAIMAVYGGGETCNCPDANAISLSCGDDSCLVPAGPPTVTIPVVEGGCYTIRPGGWNGTTGTGELTLSMTCLEGGAVTTNTVGHWDIDPGTSSYVNAGAFADVWAEGDIVYQAQIFDNKVHFYDISNPLLPNRFTEWVVGSPNTGASAQDVTSGDGLLFISLATDGFDGAEIVDVRDPFNPAHLSWITIPGFGDARNTFYDNGFLYMANGATTQVAIVDLTTYDPDAPPATISAAKWLLTAGTSPVNDMTVRNNRMYVATVSSGVAVFDVTDVATSLPVLLGQSIPQGSTNSVWPSDDGRWLVAAELFVGGPLQLYEVVPNGGGVDVLLRDTVLLPAAASTSFSRVSVVGTRVFTAAYEVGIQIYDIDETLGKLLLTASYPTFFQPVTPAFPFQGAWGVFPFLGDDRIIASDINTGLHIFSLTGNRLDFSYPSGLLELIDPDTGSTLAVDIRESCDTIDPTTAEVMVSTGGAFVPLAMNNVGGDTFEAVLTAGCKEKVSYYVRVQTPGGVVVTDPPDAPQSTYTAIGGKNASQLLADDFESDQGWTFVNDVCAGIATSLGQWVRLDPNGTHLQPENDTTPGLGTQCYVTGDGGPGDNWFNNDVDGGPYRLISPNIVIGGSDVFISYQRWFYSILFAATGVEDVLVVEVSGDGGSNWIQVEEVHSGGRQWREHSFWLSDVITPTGTVMLRFIAMDCPGASITEAAIDDVVIKAIGCTDCPLAEAPLSEPMEVRKNRYISMIPQNPGAITALRVRLDNLPSPYDVWNGRTMWVTNPRTITEQSGSDADNPAPTFTAATLSCSQDCRDWGSFGLIDVFAEGVVPSAQYQVQAIDCVCDPLEAASYSSQLSIATSKYGDLVGQLDNASCMWTPPNDVVSIPFDTVSDVDKFRNIPCSPRKARADFVGVPPNRACVDQKVSVSDYVETISAFQGASYPFSPSDSDPCNALPCPNP